MRRKTNALYVHVPFCEHICAYCDFTKLFYNQKFIEPYLEALFKEIDSFNIDKVDTIYIGGGTPSALNDSELEAILKKVSPFLRENGEFSVEGNVENLTLSKLKLLKKYGVNRLSIGVEATTNDALELLNRHHTFLETKKVISMAREVGFNNINVDLIYGYPNETIDVLNIDLENILSLNTEHISIYSLTVNPGTLFKNRGIKEQNEDDSRLFYEVILKKLRENGYIRYEVSNFAKPNYYSRHNLVYWKDEEYFGVGLGASGYLNGVRYTNTKNLEKYIKGQYIDVQEKLTKDEEIADFLLTNLRLEQGFKKLTFKNRFGFDFLDKYQNKAMKLIDAKLLIANDDTIRASDEGILLLDRILLELL